MSIVSLNISPQIPFPNSIIESPFVCVSLSRNYMARSLYKTLTLSYKANLLLSTSAPRSFKTTLRAQSTQSDFSTDLINETDQREAMAVQKIEDAIHGIMVKRSAPDWLPFVPGSSYWVPPRKDSYGIADLVDKLSNNLTGEEVMSLTTTRGWPSEAFFVHQTMPAEDEEN